MTFPWWSRWVILPLLNLLTSRLRIGLTSRSSVCVHRLKPSNRLSWSRVVLNNFVSGRTRASVSPLNRPLKIQYCVRRWETSSLRKSMTVTMTVDVSYGTNQWRGWGRLDLIDGMSPGLLISYRPPLSLVSVKKYQTWRNHHSRFVVEKSLPLMLLSIMLTPLLPIPEPKRLTFGQSSNYLTYFVQHIG